MGFITPVSLFTCMTLTSVVLSLSAFLSCSVSILPSVSASIYITSKSSFSSCRNASSTDGCSVFEVITRMPIFLRARATPNIAVLLASVPPEVKSKPFASTPNFCAIVLRAASMSFSVSKPKPWSEDGLPKCSPALTIACIAFSDGLVVAALSR